MAEIETSDVEAEEQHREDQEITVDPGIEDTDSAYGDELSIYTASVTSSVTDYQKRYHAYKEGRYLLPNDEQENDRLDMHHALIRATLKEKLYLAPIRDAPGRVIDICTGTGIWAIEFADLFPSAEVLGNDLSPIQPKLVPPNVKFLIDDVEDEWGYENEPFDFIHARYLTRAIKNMPRLLEQCYSCLKPGGWVEFQDWDAMMQSADGTGKGSYIEQYMTRTLAAFEKAGYIIRPGIFLEKWLKDAGFVNVKVTKFIVPLGTWAKDKHYKRLGAYNLLQFEQTLEGSAMAALTRIENWTKEEVNFLIAKTKNDARNPKIHSEFHFYVVYGQKPE
ncbi:hypothetical protein PAAG_03685 [Paracoccidioides lutzii Pb01]|uniref:Methyltransferase n=1 Tax=Paracoccidioides lutzii (strain ATCC MYA-826 / Pb01) TaxID=502779 RepID=C1GYU1_PARBA|nr:hypothetical protein PAAG_03685 [Paracoccidioides lutzii Pb01]EEH41764.2 hypothetical protein PAAG_03685 [Paracoccidioides lutzii Pb01]